jgi:hypothetical protein
LSRNNNNSNADTSVVALCNGAATMLGNNTTCDNISLLNNNNEIPIFQYLTFLDLSDCEVGSKGIHALVKSILLSPSSNNDTTDKRASSSGLTLQLNYNPFIGQSPSCLSTLLLSNRLISLSLTHCDIDDDGIHELACCYENNNNNIISSLTCLDLSHNHIGAKGATYISESFLLQMCANSNNNNAVQHSCKLQKLNLAFNPNIGPSGVIAIATKLKQRGDVTIMNQYQQDEKDIGGNNNDIIQEIDLSNTCCGLEGAEAILKCGGNLHSVRLFDNNLSGSFPQISNLLAGGHPNLKLLDLGGNRASDDDICALLKSLIEGNNNNNNNEYSTLQTLELGGNQITEKCEEHLELVKIKFPKLDIVRDRPLNPN